jgi:hypothetical protein
MQLVAHVLPSSVVPLAIQWTAIGLTAVGGWGVLRRRQALLDSVSWSMFSVGAIGCLTMVGIAMLAPPPPAYTLSLVLGRLSTSPVQVTACASKLDGASVTTPDGDHLLGVLVDGAQVANESTNVFLVAVPSGHHTLRVELLTRDHREFSPAVIADTTVDVASNAPLAPWAACPR